MSIEPLNSSLENKYFGIKGKILGKINSGDYMDKLPSGKFLAEEFGANIKTVDKAIKSLEEDGILQRSKGKGTFILSDSEKDSARKQKSSPVMIGILSPLPEQMKDSWLSSTLTGIQTVIEKSGMNIILKGYHFRNGLDGEKAALANLLQCGISGLIAYPFISDGGLTNQNIYRKLDIPLVFFDRYLENFDTDFAGVDHYEVGRAAAEFLISRGHRKIAHIAPSGNVKNTEDRIRGFNDALLDAGIPLSEDCFARTQSYEDADSIKSFLQRLAKVSATAVFASHDGYALAVYAAAQELGINIPDDISLIGFGNAAATGLLNITSIDQSLAVTGRSAAEMLVARINDPKKNGKVIHKVLPISIIERASVKNLK